MTAKEMAIAGLKILGAIALGYLALNVIAYLLLLNSF